MNENNALVPVDKKPKEAKMTFEEYEKKYSRKGNATMAKTFLFMFVAFLGIIIVCAEILVVVKLFEFNQIVGYIGIGVAVLVFILFYIVPIVKIAKMPAFKVDVDRTNAAAAKRHNRKMRRDIADNMIDIYNKTDKLDWYREEAMGRLALARQSNDDENLKAALTDIYNVDIKDKAWSMIRAHAVQIGVLTALSQSERIDTLVVALFELNLIKRIIYMYGFRPSEQRLLKMYAAIVRNSLIAYGVSSVGPNIANSIVQTIGGVVEKIPILGAVIATVIDSASQGIINSSMTVILGTETLHYLRKEYRLQDILDTIDVGEEEESEMIKTVNKEVKQNLKEHKPKTA